MNRRALWGVVMLGACATRVPAHLAVEPPSATQDQPEAAPTNVDEALAQLVRRDPLARAPQLLDEEIYAALSDGEALAAFVRNVVALERGEGEVSRTLGQLEDEYPTSAIAPLTRGYRFRLVENLIATNPTPSELQQIEIAMLLTSFRNTTLDDTLPRPPLTFLGLSENSAAGLRTIGERWVLESWLASPELSLESLGPALEAPQYDGLRQTPTGALVFARATAADGDIEGGLDHLRRATQLALVRAAADRDHEQAAWSDLRAATSTELGVSDPIRHHLESASTELTAAASTPIGAGGALLAIQALRWRNQCPDTPCGGGDRVSTMRSSEAWSDETAHLSRIWQIIALKESLDGMDAGRETVRFPIAMIDLCDALHGTVSGSLDLHLMRRLREDSAVWLEVSRYVGVEGVTDWEEARVAIGSLLAQKSLEIAASSTTSEERELLERIAQRAVP